MTGVERSTLDDCRSALRHLAGMAKPRMGEWLELDMSMGQLKALFALTLQGPQPVGRLGRLLDIGEPAASLLVDRLEERGFAKREDDPHDRRKTIVVPTEEARKLVVRLRQTRDEQVTEWLERMSEVELDHLLAGLEALLRAAEAATANERLEGTTT